MAKAPRRRGFFVCIGNGIIYSMMHSHIPPELRLTLEEYETLHPKSVAASKLLSDQFEKLGKPEDPVSTEAGQKMMSLIIDVWADLYPDQMIDWVNNKMEYQASEKTIEEQVQNKTGRSIASIPTPVYNMTKRIFPKYKLDNRETFIKLVETFPVFRMTNKV